MTEVVVTEMVEWVEVELIEVELTEIMDLIEVKQIAIMDLIEVELTEITDLIDMVKQIAIMEPTEATLERVATTKQPTALELPETTSQSHLLSKPTLQPAPATAEAREAAEEEARRIEEDNRI